MQIVSQHGGSISLESEIGKGALFAVRLPVEKKA
jgi:signal transduction histidine kinase